MLSDYSRIAFSLRLAQRRGMNFSSRIALAFTATFLSLMITGLLAQGAGLADAGLIDSCAYATPAAAQQAWKPMGATAPVQATTLEGAACLRLICNFTNQQLERASWDRSENLDLASCRGIEFQLRCKNSEPVSYFAIYFESGSGWYHADFFPESDRDWNVIKVDKSNVTTEGKPEGWGKIKTIRVSAWKGKAINTELWMRGMRKTGALGEDTQVAIMRADSAAQRWPEEKSSYAQYAETIAGHFDASGVPCSVVSDLDLSAEVLNKTKLLILPYNPIVPEKAAPLLNNFVQQGGKLMAFYIVPEPLKPLLGVQAGEHVNAPSPGAFSQIRFMSNAVPGAPALVKQQSWNITAYAPVAGKSRTVAEWLNEQRQASGYPTIISSGNGMVMTHVILGDDASQKRRMLLAMTGALLPEIWEAATKANLENAGAISGYHGFKEAVAGITALDPNDKRVSEIVLKAKSLWETASTLNQEHRYAEAMESASRAKQAVEQAFCMAQSPESGEFRAFWCHSAFGVNGMEWDEAIQRLAQNGFTAILPNMLWGGAAYYESKVLPVASPMKAGGDQIARCLAACRKYGLQIHVWKVNWNLGSAVPKEFVERMRAEGRLQASSQGREEPWLCPSHPLNQKLEIDSMVEVARNYDVDGIHFDYIRYPDNDHCFCAGCKERFETATGQKVTNWPADLRKDGPLRRKWLDWRRANITTVVKAVSEQSRAIRPKIKISAAVFSHWKTDRDGVGQDWKLWCERGYVDFVCPMDYTPSNRNFENMVKQQVEWAGKVPCYPGIGVSASSSHFGVDRVIEQIQLTRAHHTGGFTIFNYGVTESKELVPLLGLGITRK